MEYDFILRCSSISKVMGSSTRGKSLTDNQLIELQRLEGKRAIKRLTPKQEITYQDYKIRKEYKREYDISTGAMTYVANCVKKFFYKYQDQQLDNPKILKGHLNEEQNIKLYNDVFFTNYKKTQYRVVGEFLSGTNDMFNHKIRKVVDIKSAFTWNSFCALEEELEEHCKKSGYFLQGRGYMNLYDCDTFEVAHCMSTTPDHLIPLHEEDYSRHLVDINIPLESRITVVQIERDLEIEKEILYKVAECKRYANWYLSRLMNKNIA